MNPIAVRSPFRIPLGGGGHDLPEQWRRCGGFLLTATIDKYLTVTIQDWCVPVLANTPMLLHYAAAAGIKGGAIDVKSDIPPGSGLGGSSSLMVALLRTRHPALQPHELAMAAYHAERYTLGQPVGYQDAFAAAFGGCQALDIDTRGRVETRPVTLPPDFQDRLLVMATGIQRSAADVLRQQARATTTRLVCREAMEQIATLGRTIYRDLLDNGGRRYGELTDQHWRYKVATCPAVTSPVVDAWYDLARANGASGGKLLGAGGGGYFLFVVEPAGRYHLLQTMTAAGLTELPFRFTDQGARIVT